MSMIIAMGLVIIGVAIACWAFNKIERLDNGGYEAYDRF